MNPEFTREIPILVARRRKLRTGDMKSRRRITCVMRTTHPKPDVDYKDDGTRDTSTSLTTRIVLLNEGKDGDFTCLNSSWVTPSSRWPG